MVGRMSDTPHEFKDAMAVLRELRSMGAIHITVGNLSAQFLPLVEKPAEDKPVPAAVRMTAEKEAELAMLRERYQMDEELGNV
jgi:hypothetical protein